MSDASNWSWPAPTGPLAVFAIERVFKAELEGLLRAFPCGPIEKAVASGARFLFGVSSSERIAIRTFSTPEELAAAYVGLMEHYTARPPAPPITNMPVLSSEVWELVCRELCTRLLNTVAPQGHC